MAGRRAVVDSAPGLVRQPAIVAEVGQTSDPVPCAPLLDWPTDGHRGLHPSDHLLGGLIHIRQQCETTARPCLLRVNGSCSRCSRTEPGYPRTLWVPVLHPPSSPSR